MEKRRKSKKARRRLIQKMIPILIAVVLIIIVALFSLATGILQKYSYSSQRADLYEYFNLTSEDEAAILLDNQYMEQKALCQNGKYYVDEDTVINYFNNNFYYNQNEQLLLYTTGTETIRADKDSREFIEKDGKVYIALDYIKRFTNLEINAFDNPNHIEIKHQWNTVSMADIKKDTQLRILGGVKSDILIELKAGDTVEIMNPMDEWTEVKSTDAYIGYVENKKLTNYRDETPTPVTDVASLEISHNLRDYKICLGWHQVMSATANSTIDAVTANASAMNVISPTWFSLVDLEGNISNIGSSDYVQTAHEKGLEVWGLVDNFNPEVNTYEVLSSTAKRQVLINQLIDASLSLGIDGINVDFENLSGECGVHFAQFIRELSIPCRQNGLVLSVDNYVPKEYTEHYNRKVQGEFADYVIIMGYDEHYSGSDESGSVASFNFVQDGIEKTLKDVPANQVINGIPFYTRIWQEAGTISSEAVGMQAAKDTVAANGATTAWNDEAAQNYAEWIKGGTTYKVWLEDADSISAKLQLMSANQLAGVACWKLGFETPDIWGVIQDYMNAK